MSIKMNNEWNTLTYNETFYNCIWYYTQSPADTCLVFIIKVVTTSFNTTPNISEADATWVSANVPQPNTSQNSTKQLTVQATTITTSKISVSNATLNISEADATQVSTNMAQPNTSQNPTRQLIA